MSLISRYVDFLQEKSIDFDLIYMDKYGIKEELAAKRIYKYENTINSKLPRTLKVFKYLSFRRFAIPILKRNNYDYIIVWNDVAIYTFGLYLARHYKNRYCLNIRDYMKQDIFPFKYIYKRAVRNAHFSTISSKGFVKYLPIGKYVLMHSMNNSILSKIQPRSVHNQKLSLPIRISFVGNVRYYSINEKIMSIFKNDYRFELHYHGSNSGPLKEYSKSNNINNTIISGTFKLNDSYKYISQSDIINNLYGTSSNNLKSAISIKFYHAVYLNIPILVFDGTYLSELVKKYKLGYIVNNLEPDLPKKIYDWYCSLDQKKFIDNCNIFKRVIYNEEKEFKKRLEEMVS
jgi:hypothetical protein